MRVLICSGRFYADTHTITHVLDLYARTQTINVLIHGGHQALGGAIEKLGARDRRSRDPLPGKLGAARKICRDKAQFVYAGR